MSYSSFACFNISIFSLGIPQDESFAEILINNPHVTHIRNSKKGNASQMEQSQTIKHRTVEPSTSPQTPPPKLREKYEEKFEKTFREEPPHKFIKSPYMPTPTRRGQVRRPIKTDDSIEIDPYDLWFVSDESFLEMEKSCESPRENDPIDSNDTTLLNDVEAPSFLNNYSDLEDSVFEDGPSSISMLSPMKQVALRRPSTILEESTVQSISSSEDRSACSSLSLKQSVHHTSVDVSSQKSVTAAARSYRPSLVNVFPTRSRIGFYDSFENQSSTTTADTSTHQQSSGKENSINLMSFECVGDQASSQQEQNVTNRAANNSICLIEFDSIDEASNSNFLSVDQTQHDSSMSDGEQPPDQFNDTLEAVDYYMKRGKKILDKTSASMSFHQQPCVVSSPKNRNNSLLKQTLARRHLMSMNGGGGDINLANKKLF